MRIRWTAFLAAALVPAMSSAAASAQSDRVVLSGSGANVMTSSQADARVAELEEAYNSVKLAGPRAGVGISAIFVAGGAFMLGTGLGVRNFEQTFFCPPETPRCGEAGPAGTALAISGAVALVAGVTGAILSSRKLKRKKMERKRIQRETDQLDRSLR